MEIRMAKKYEEDARALEIIENAQADKTTVEEYAEMAVDAATMLRTVGDCCVEVLKAVAMISEQKGGALDVQITTTAMTYEGFYIVKAWLSDIKKLAAGNQKKIAAKMDIRYFKESK